MNYLRTASGASTAHAGSPVGFAEPPVSAVPANRAHTPAPVPPAPPVAPAPPPAQSVAPVAPPAPAPVSKQDDSAAIFVHLTSGERIWAGRFDSTESAERRANEIVRALNRPEPGVWAKFGSRLIRPEAVVSVEIAARRDD